MVRGSLVLFLDGVVLCDVFGVYQSLKGSVFCGGLVFSGYVAVPVKGGVWLKIGRAHV